MKDEEKLRKLMAALWLQSFEGAYLEDNSFDRGIIYGLDQIYRLMGWRQYAEYEE